MAVSIEGAVRKLLKAVTGVEPKGTSVEAMLDYAANNYSPKSGGSVRNGGIKSIVGNIDNRNVLHITFTMEDGSSHSIEGRINTFTK